MTIRPLKDLVLVKRLETEDKIGLIHVPDKARIKALRGTVIAQGPGRRSPQDGRLMPPDVHVGDLILFGLYSGNDIVIEGVEYIIMKEEEILGVMAHHATGHETPLKAA